MQSGVPIPSENPPAYESAIIGSGVGTCVPHLISAAAEVTLYFFFYLTDAGSLVIS